MLPSKIYAIGGALELIETNEILLSFIKSCGDKESNILLVPSYHSDEQTIQETWDLHKTIFEKLGVKQINYCRPHNSLFDSKKYEHLVNDATGVFFAGGSQRQLVSMILNTDFLIAIKNKWKIGKLAIAGTSAGCAALSQEMILGGLEEPILGVGLGFIDSILLDQHFSSGNKSNRVPRLPRLTKALNILSAENKKLLGVGVDENTCALIHNNTIEVLGQDTVTIVDLEADPKASKLTHGQKLEIS